MAKKENRKLESRQYKWRTNSKRWTKEKKMDQTRSNRAGKKLIKLVNVENFAKTIFDGL